MDIWITWIRRNHVKYNWGIDYVSFVFAGDMQMFPGAAPRITCNPNNITKQRRHHSDPRRFETGDNNWPWSFHAGAWHTFQTHYPVLQQSPAPATWHNTSAFRAYRSMPLWNSSSLWMGLSDNRKANLSWYVRADSIRLDSVLPTLLLCPHLTMKPCRVRTSRFQEVTLSGVTSALRLSSWWDFQQWLYSDCPDRKPCLNCLWLDNNKRGAITIRVLLIDANVKTVLRPCQRCLGFTSKYNIK